MGQAHEGSESERRATARAADEGGIDRRELLLAVCSGWGCLSAALAAAEGESTSARLKFVSGRITYRVTTPTGSMVRVHSWTNSGAKFREDTTMTLKSPRAGMPKTGTMWTIHDGQYLHQYLGRPNQVRRTVLPGPAFASFQSMFHQVEGARKLGEESVAGKKCRVIQAGDTKMWQHEGLLLKMVTGNPRNPAMRLEATKVELGIAIDASLFRVPAGFEIVDAPVLRPKEE